MIHVPEEQKHYLRQIIIIMSISYYYYYYYYYTIMHNVYKLNKPCYMFKVSHLQYHSL